MKRLAALLLASLLASGTVSAANAPAVSANVYYAGEKTPGLVISGGERGSLLNPNIETGEAILHPGGGLPQGESALQLEAYKKKVTPNKVTILKLLPLDEVYGLRIDASLCGVAVEPSESQKLQLDYVGVEDASRFSVETSLADGVLTVSIQGGGKDAFYVNPSPSCRANTIRIGVPEGILDSLELSGDCFSMWISDLDLPVDGRVGNSIVQISDEERTADCDLDTGNGMIYVKSRSLSGTVALETKNGTAWVSGSSISGWVDLNTVNGSVQLETDVLANGLLVAQNGKARATVGTIERNLTMETEKGKLETILLREPVNLDYRLEAGQTRGLPEDYRESRIIGEGGPALDILGGKGQPRLIVGDSRTLEEIAEAAFADQCPGYTMKRLRIVAGDEKEFLVHYDRIGRNNRADSWELLLVRAQSDGSYAPYSMGEEGAETVDPLPMYTVPGYGVAASGNALARTIRDREPDSETSVDVPDTTVSGETVDSSENADSAETGETSREPEEDESVKKEA